MNVSFSSTFAAAMQFGYAAKNHSISYFFQSFHTVCGETIYLCEPPRSQKMLSGDHVTVIWPVCFWAFKCYNVFSLPYDMSGLIQLSFFAYFNLIKTKVLLKTNQSIYWILCISRRSQ